MRGERAEGVRDGAGEVGGMDVRTIRRCLFFRFRTVYFYKVEREEGDCTGDRALGSCLRMYLVGVTGGLGWLQVGCTWRR